MNLYEAIYVRQSVRRFQEKPIDQLTLKHIRRYMQAVSPLYEDIRWHMELIDASADKKAVRGIWKADAPYYMVIYTEEGKRALCNAGFIMEQLALYLVTKGIGSCYQGCARAGRTPEAAADLEAVMILAFGWGKEGIERDVTEARRMRLQDLVVKKEELGDDLKTMLRAARLAPSAWNRQPWRFVAYRNRIHVFEKIPGRRFFVSRKARDFDIGIALSHFVLAAEELWLHCEVRQMERVSEREIKHYEYAATVFIQ